MGGTASARDMHNDNTFLYDSEGNLIEDRSKGLKISYDWRGMPVEFVHDVSNASEAYKLTMAYAGLRRPGHDVAHGIRRIRQTHLQDPPVQGRRQRMGNCAGHTLHRHRDGGARKFPQRLTEQHED